MEDQPTKAPAPARPPRERQLVVEHRISCNLGARLVRFWIEADPAYGGVEDYEQARKQAQQLIDSTLRALRFPTESNLDTCKRFLQEMPAISSVEIVTGLGNGVTCHRDWP